MVEVSDACINIRFVSEPRKDETIPFSITYSVFLIFSIRLLYASRSSSGDVCFPRPWDDRCMDVNNGMIATTGAQQAVLCDALLL
jgi:hypothetical protein